mgnify:FL=1
MKKFLIALSLVLATVAASAQVKSDADIMKAIDKAKADAANPKKADKPDTWLKLTKAYINAYSNPLANVAGGDKNQVMMLLGSEKPISEEVVNIGGEPFEKAVFEAKNLYFNRDGYLAITEVTKPSYPGDALAEAASALAKAYEVDAAGKKTKDIDAFLQQISGFYTNDGNMAYYLGDVAKAGDLFEKAATVSLQQPCTVVDTNAVYNTALTSLMARNYGRAEKYYKKSMEIGNYSEGSAYSGLAECYLAQGDTLAARRSLEEGFAVYPSNDRIITGLIDLYRMVNEDPAKILVLLDEAKAKMPDNPALYYVEGDILSKMDKFDEAVAAYRKAADINPNYEWGYYGEGILWFQRAVDAQVEANDLPYNEYKKYDELMANLNTYLKNALEPFEKCFALTGNDALKAAAADNLKRIYFALRSESPDYQAAYEKYAALAGE